MLSNPESNSQFILLPKEFGNWQGEDPRFNPDKHYLKQEFIDKYVLIGSFYPNHDSFQKSIAQQLEWAKNLPDDAVIFWKDIDGTLTSFHVSGSIILPSFGSD